MKEKTADEMFKELRYEIEIIENGFEFLKIGEEKEIDFIEVVDTKQKEIWIDDFHKISMQELQAINKKCKELRMVR